jgi:ferredoxin-NADP reductase
VLGCVFLQLDRMQQHVAQLKEQLQAATLREEQVRLEAQAAAEERCDIQLQQQQLKYERHIQVCGPGSLAACMRPATAPCMLYPAGLSTTVNR